MQDTFAHATHSAAAIRPSATIGYLVYKQDTFPCARTRPKKAMQPLFKFFKYYLTLILLRVFQQHYC